MTCSTCGAYVTPSVRFCSNCGAAVDSEATRIVRLQSRALENSIDGDLEHTIFTVRPTMIFIKTGYALAVLGGIALTIAAVLDDLGAWTAKVVGASYGGLVALDGGRVLRVPEGVIVMDDPHHSHDHDHHPDAPHDETCRRGTHRAHR